MKLLWVSNATFTRTGYGTATRAVTKQMLADGHEPHVLAYWGLQGSRMEVDGVEHYSPRTDTWGNDYANELAGFLKCQFILTHRDIWVDRIEEKQKAPYASWFPVDQSPLAQINFDNIVATRWPATMTRSGVAECANAGLEVTYLPHSVNTDIFKYSRSRAARSIMGVPDDAFLITIVAANKGFPSRKGFPEMFEAVSALMLEHKDVWLYIHSCVTAEQGGPDLQKMAEFYKMDLDRVRLLSPFLFHFGVDDEQLATFYAASDVLLNTSYGEGFGLPILEAQAVGTPVVTTNFGAMKELTWNGVAVVGEMFMNAMYRNWCRPLPGAIADGIRSIYDTRWCSDWKGKEVADAISKNWSDKAIYDTYWKPFLVRIERELALE